MLSSPDKRYHKGVSFPAISVAPCSEPYSLRAFITDTISTAYAFERLFNTILTYVIVWPSACFLLFVLDNAYNGVTTLVLPAFLPVNASSVSLFYGSAPWRYYLSQALPLLTGSALPFDLHGTYLAVMHGPRHLKLLFYTARTSTLLSFSGHKELCFLYSFTGQICHSLSFHPSDQVD